MIEFFINRKNHVAPAIDDPDQNIFTQQELIPILTSLTGTDKNLKEEESKYMNHTWISSTRNSDGWVINSRISTSGYVQIESYPAPPEQ